MTEPTPSAFDLERFQRVKFVPRTAEVRVDALAAFFPPDTPPIFVVRNLSGEEMARVAEAGSRRQNIAAALAAIASGTGGEKIQALRETLGLDSEQMPDDLARRIEQLAIGCVDPVLDAQVAAKVFRVAPVAGYELTNRINILSGQGMEPGE